ncbi:hypothetical protein [Pseudoclavibacter terrae]|uniref:Uncharacterized protein n=1 Tax=Pseudoclavibacter terrae TaxID=1530195 RepID=A0A7J5B2T6_9MICO|nr:hypothetical protein [Pseudoclavibacter terrae]KAB1638336.1 hypothetical protein F8O03_08030 [Pseudoclavibacter terrae]
MRDHVLVLLLVLAPGRGRGDMGLVWALYAGGSSLRESLGRRHIPAGAGHLAAQKGLRETMTIGSVRVHGVGSAHHESSAGHTHVRWGLRDPRHEEEGDSRSSSEGRRLRSV